MRKRLIKKSLVFACAILMCSASISAQSDWATFWGKFKTAVAKSDKKTILSLSKEKLSDSEYKELFGTRARQNCFAKAKAVRDEQGYYSVFCGEQGYLFQKIGGQFKFVEGFPND